MVTEPLTTDAQKLLGNCPALHFWGKWRFFFYIFFANFAGVLECLWGDVQVLPTHKRPPRDILTIFGWKFDPTNSVVFCVSRQISFLLTIDFTDRFSASVCDSVIYRAPSVLFRSCCCCYRVVAHARNSWDLYIVPPYILKRQKFCNWIISVQLYRVIRSFPNGIPQQISFPLSSAPHSSFVRTSADIWDQTEPSLFPLSDSSLFSFLTETHKRWPHTYTHQTRTNGQMGLDKEFGFWWLSLSRTKRQESWQSTSE